MGKAPDHPPRVRRKVCVVITARASYSRIRAALSALKERADVELQIVAAASAVLERYGNAVKFMRADGFEVSAQIHSIIEGENVLTSAKSTGLGLVELATVLSGLAPDVVVTIGDRFETIATAVAAAYMNIPLAHVQGGEVTGSIDEKVRHATTKLADLHLVASRQAYERVVRMGEDPSRVFITGCPSIDLAKEVVEAPPAAINPFEKYGGVGERLDLNRGYLMVLQHPVTTEYDEARFQVEETLYAVRDLGLATLWFWPNVDAGSDGVSKGIRVFREREKPANIHFFRHVDSIDFLRLAKDCLCIVGNSSVAIRECSFLGAPAVNIGSRQSGRDRGRNVLDAPHDRRAIVRAIRDRLAHGPFPQDTLYGRGDAGPRIAECLATAELTIEKRLAFDAAERAMQAARAA
jgi:UDP-hydrolysing UDP-N-acetyl-D-glucosamine 2-epimerase